MKGRTKLTGQQVLPVSLHIRELRSRLLFCGLVFIAGSVVGYLNQQHLIAFMKGLIDESLYYTSPAGNFSFIMKISAVVGLAMVVPVLVFNLLRFIQPALEKKIRYSRIWIASTMSLVLALAGIAFAIFLIMPIALHFFAGFRVNGVEALISANSYLDFITKAVMSFAVLFQIPLILLIINSIRPIPPGTLLKYERHVIVAAFVVGLLMPFAYDPVTQLIIATPIIVLYNLSILVIWLSARRTSTRTKPEIMALSVLAANIPQSKFSTNTPSSTTGHTKLSSPPIQKTTVTLNGNNLATPNRGVSVAGTVSDFSKRPTFLDLSVKDTVNHKHVKNTGLRNIMRDESVNVLSIDSIVSVSN